MHVWSFILQQFAAGSSIMLMYVLESIGSSPGRRGFHMAVSSNGRLCGTIGGGIMEHKFVEMCRALLRGEPHETGVFRQVHHKDAVHRSGMICSGEQTIFIYRIQQKDIPYLEALVKSLQKNENGNLLLNNDGIYFDNSLLTAPFEFEMNEHTFWLKEKTGFKNVLHVVGGGHCSLALCRLMQRMDFKIYVYDDRKDLNTLHDNEFAHHKIVVTDYSDVNRYIEEGHNVYVVIMTFGFRTDDIALRSLASKSFRYLGLLGSKNKIAQMFNQYKNEGISEQWLNTIHAPVGLDIKSETAEEIAISIAAQIVAEKNKVSG